MESNNKKVSEYEKERFEANLKVYCFKCITNQLAERKLITKEEEKRIRKHIDKMYEEANSVKPKPRS